MQQVAKDLRQQAVGPWPPEAGVPESHVCARMEILHRDVVVALAPGHKCNDPERMFLCAAAAMLDFFETGPDAGWTQTPSGSYVTGISDTQNFASAVSTRAIPVSEAQRLEEEGLGHQSRQ